MTRTSLVAQAKMTDHRQQQADDDEATRAVNEGSNDNRNDINDDDDDDHSIASVGSNDSTLQSIQFQSVRDDNGLERGISFVWPSDPNARKITLSTLLEPGDLAPLFAGAQWAGTRVWHAAIHGMYYMERQYSKDATNGASLLELGCGLGLPGMVWHMLGGNAVLSDQESIMSQLHGNLESSFADTTCRLSIPVAADAVGDNANKAMAGGGSRPSRISALPLSWSREGVRRLLTSSGYPNGFDYVLNCDCVYEPLYGKSSWELLVDVIDELLCINPSCTVVSSVERRRADGIDSFVEHMKSCDHVGSVEKVLHDDRLKLEIYVTTGISMK